MANTRANPSVFLPTPTDEEKKSVITEEVAVTPPLTTTSLRAVESRKNALHANGLSGHDHRVFISHRGTYKGELAFPMVAIFSYFCGPYFVAFDQVTLELGKDNNLVLSESLSRSAHCLVIVSKDFFESQYTVDEVDAFLTAQKDAKEPRKLIPLFVGISPHECCLLDMSHYLDQDGNPLSPEKIHHRQMIAKKLSKTSGRQQAPDESLRDFVLKQMRDLIENELRGKHSALSPKFHNKVDPQLLAYVYDKALLYYKKVNGKVNQSNLEELMRELDANSIAWQMIASIMVLLGILFKLTLQLASMKEKKHKEEERSALRKENDLLLKTLLCGIYRRQSQLENILTGVSLSLDEGHYVQFTLVKEEDQKQEEENTLSKSASREERIGSYEKIHGAQAPIELEGLFQRAKEDKQAPKKLLILGRAGIGKTTLCQYIAYRWSKGTLWNDQFDAIFWVPLRELSGYSEEDTQRETILLWLMQRCWKADKESALNKERISEYLRAHQGRLLFLLDGYDEVAHLKGQQTKPGQVLDLLLCQEHIVLTSRPNYVDTLLRGTEKQVDRCVENIGFTSDHIEQYVRHFFIAHKAANEEKALLAYLKQNSSIFGTAHVPINLSLICSVWYNDSKKGQVNIAFSKTMTGLYDRMVDALLDRYLEKMLSREELSRLSNRTKEKKKVTVVRFLSRLGFVVTQKSTRQIVISAEIFNTVFNEVFEKEPIGLSCDDFFTAIHQTGFLTPVSSHRHHPQNTKDFYFLHLTFQEYFTAKYLTEVFIRGVESAEEAITCLKKHKFDPNYEVVWWFTAGLIQQTNDLSIKELFWQKMSEPPRDLTLLREMAFFSCLLRESEEENQEEPNLSPLLPDDRILYLEKAKGLSQKKVWLEIVSQYLARRLEREEIVFSKIERDIIRSAPEKVINQLFSSCLDKMGSENTQETIKGLSVLRSILFRASEEQMKRAIFICKEVVLQNRKNALSQKVVYVLPELLQCTSQDNLDEILSMGISILNNINIPQSLRGTVIGSLLELDPKKLTEKAAYKLGSWYVDALNQLEEQTIYDDTYSVKTLFRKCFFAMSKEHQHQMIENFLMRLYDSEVNEKIKANIAGFFQQSFLRLNETQQQRIFHGLLAWLRETHVGDRVKKSALDLLKYFFQHLHEAKQQEIITATVALVREGDREDLAKNSALDLLRTFFQHLNETQRQQVSTTALALLGEAKVDVTVKRRALGVLEVFSSYLNEVQREEAFRTTLALVREAGIGDWIKISLFNFLQSLFLISNKAQRQEAFTAVLTLVKDASVGDWVKSRALDLLKFFFPHLNEAEQQEIITAVLALVSEAGIDSGVKCNAFDFLQLFFEYLSEAEHQEVIRVAVTLGRKASVDDWVKSGALDLLRSFFPHLTAAQRQEVFITALALMREAGIGDKLKSSAFDLLKVFFPKLNEVQREEVFTATLALVRDASVGDRLKIGALVLLEVFSPKLNEIQEKEAFTAILALVREAGVYDKLKISALNFLQVFFQHLNETQRQEAFTAVLSLVREGSVGQWVKSRALDFLRVFSPQLNEMQRQEAIITALVCLREADITDDFFKKSSTPSAKKSALDFLKIFFHYPMNKAHQEETVNAILTCFSEISLSDEVKKTTLVLLKDLFPRLSVVEQVKIVKVSVALLQNAKVNNPIKEEIVSFLIKTLPVKFDETKQNSIFYHLLEHEGMTSFLKMISHLTSSPIENEKVILHLVINMYFHNEAILARICRDINKWPFILFLEKNLSGTFNLIIQKDEKKLHLPMHLFPDPEKALTLLCYIFRKELEDRGLPLAIYDKSFPKKEEKTIQNDELNKAKNRRLFSTRVPGYGIQKLQKFFSPPLDQTTTTELSFSPTREKFAAVETTREIFSLFSSRTKPIPFLQTTRQRPNVPAQSKNTVPMPYTALVRSAIINHTRIFLRHR
jgi:hypothetical protein